MLYFTAVLQDLSGKAIGIWLPISAFAMLGFEHCIANQYLFAINWFTGGNISAKAFIWDNLIPATLGNYVGTHRNASVWRCRATWWPGGGRVPPIPAAGASHRSPNSWLGMLS